MAGWMTSTVVSSHLDTLATGNPAACTRSRPADWAAGWAGGKSGYVKVAATTPASPAARWAVLITGGVHARELAPPDALVSFLEKLLPAYTASNAITYPAWTDPVDGIVYDSFTIPWPWVKNIVERLDLYVVPLVNDDGRDFALTVPASTADQALHKGWRKNRRPAPAGVTDPHGIGVDINRNFDIVWNFPKFYDVALSDIANHSSTNPVDETYVGDVTSGTAESEPETKNVANLMRTKGVSFFLDVHAFGRDVMYSWGIESDQTNDATMNFANQIYDGKRDGTSHTAYSEYIPASTLAAAQAFAQNMCAQILAKAGGSDPRARTRSVYTAKPSADLYVTSGACDDYCFSRWFTAATAGTPVSPVMAFTAEIGGDPDLGADYDEGGFIPNYVNNYPKLEREIHVAAWAFLNMIAAQTAQGPSAPPAPTPPPPATSGGGSCLMLLMCLLLAIGSVIAVVAGPAVAGTLLGGGAVAAWLARRRQ
jgi:hypothetical protein